MNNPDQIISKIKSAGHRITKARSQIIELFINSSIPINITDIKLALENLDTKVNRTTIYRELDFLLKEKVIQEIELGENKKRYELLSEDNHHHHIICINCKKIEDVELHTDLSKEEATIDKEKNFKTLNHSLEFFGLCSNCR